MGECSQCGAHYEREGAPFCSECGAPRDAESQRKQGRSDSGPDIAQEAPRDNLESGRTLKRDDAEMREEYLRAVAGAVGDGLVDDRDREQLEEMRRQLRLSKEEAATLESQAMDDLTAGIDAKVQSSGAAITVEINDSHFYMEKHLGVLDLRLSNPTQRPLDEVRLSVAGNYLGARDEHRFRLRPGATVRRKVQIHPSTAGEHLVELVLSYREDDGLSAYIAQPVLKVLGRDESPSNLTLVIDQRMQAGRNIGYGMSVQNEVKEGVAKGLIRSANDLLRQRFADSWNRVALSYDDDLSRELVEKVAAPSRVVPAAPGPPTDRAALICRGSLSGTRTLLLGQRTIRMGRSRGANDVVLRVLPRSERNNRLSRQIQGREHFSLSLRRQGLYVVDSGSLNGTRLNGEPVEGESPIPLDQPSELDVGKALRLRLLPFLERADEPAIDAGPYERLGEPDALWQLAAELKLRSLLISRHENLADEEHYLVVYRWAEVGRGPGHEIVVPDACPERRCLRLLRLGGGFWGEPLSERACLAAGKGRSVRGQAWPLRNGLGFACKHLGIDVAPFAQEGL